MFLILGGMDRLLLFASAPWYLQHFCFLDPNQQKYFMAPWIWIQGAKFQPRTEKIRFVLKIQNNCVKKEFDNSSFLKKISNL